MVSVAGAAEARKADLAVYGATPAGISAAVNAAREGLDVVLLQEDRHVGGLASGGLSNSDFKSFEALGGTFREFMQGVKADYVRTFGPDSQQVIDCVEGGYYAPKVARRVFERMLSEAGVTVLLEHRLTGTRSKPTGNGKRRRLTHAEFRNLATGDSIGIAAGCFVDATYEGDLIASAGVEYRVGCEAKSEYGESQAFDEANEYVQTYNFRVCLTQDPANRVPISKPADYDRSRYTPLLDDIESGLVKSFDQRMGPRPVLKVRPMADQKADFNDVWNSPVSLSVENVNHPWPEGSPETRQGIYDFYKGHSLGLFWFLGNDPEIPAPWREAMLKWGLPRDEFPDNGHWSPALYVREARRMAGVRVFTQHDTQAEPGMEKRHARARLQKDSIAIGDYNHNCHGVWSPAPGEPSIGHFTHRIQGPFQVPYGVLIPKEIDGLLAPGPVSSSHIGFCALRMEPVWTALGQASGLAAAQARKHGKLLRDLDVTRLQLRLHELGALTVYASDLGTATDIPRPAWDRPGTTFRAHLHHVPVKVPHFRSAQFLGTRGFFHGIIDLEAERAKKKSRPGSTGQWGTRFLNHFIKPNQPIDPGLAERWIRMAKEDLQTETSVSAGQAVENKMTRGEFLDQLFAAFKEQNGY